MASSTRSHDTDSSKKRTKSESKSPQLSQEKESSSKDKNVVESEDEKKVKKVKKEDEVKGKEVKVEDDNKEVINSAPEEPSGIAQPGDSPPDSFGKLTKESAERKHGILERGHIYFIYRPKVEKTEAHNLDEISRLQILLLPSPDSSSSSSSNSNSKNDKKNFRLLVVGRKRIPKTGPGNKHEVLWGKVIGVSNDLSSLREKLGARTYDTKTLGERHLAPARIAARGDYIFTSPSSNLESVPENSKNYSAIFKTYLAYKIAVPNELGEVQDQLRIENEGCFSLQVKNPDSKSNNPVVRDPKIKAAFPSLLKSLFTTKFIPSNPPSLLNYSGAEILMIGTSHSIKENIGEEVLDELKKEVEAEQAEFYGDDDGGEDEEAIKEEAAKKALAELGMEEGGVVEALEGHWI